MSTYMTRVLLVLLAWGGLLRGQDGVTNVYLTQFELGEGYASSLRLDAQNEWTSIGSGGNGLVTNYFDDMGQHAYIGFSPPTAGESYLWLWRPLSIPTVPTNSVLKFSVTMGIWDSSNGEYDDFQWQVYNTLGNRLFSLDFDNSNMRVYYLLDSGASYEDTGVPFTNAGTYQLEIIMDPHSNRWSAQLGGLTLVTDQPMTTTGQPLDIADIDAVWWVYNAATPGNNYMVFDNYQVVLKPRKNLLNTQFEMREGFAPSLHLSGQCGWTSIGSGGNGLLTNFYAQMGQSAYIGFNPPAAGDSALWLWRPLIVPAIPTNHVIKFSVMMGVWDSDNGRYDDFQWEVYNTLGDNLFTLDFDNNNLHIYYLLDGSTNYQDTGVTFSNEVVYLLEITMDMDANQWSAKLGGAALVANQPMTTTGKSLNLADIDAAWRIHNPGSAGNNYMVFDQYRVDLDAKTVRPVILYESDTVTHTTTLRWAGSGALQASELVEGPYSDVPGATSPYTLNNQVGTRFYRVRK